jgi:hypothetical protein
MRKCNDEVYQLAKDQALVKKLKNKIFRSFAMSIAKHLMWFTSLTVTSAGRNTKEKVSNHSTKEWMDTEVREQLGQRFTFFNFFPMMTDNACNFL